MTKRRRKATDPVYELRDLEVVEVSLVDSPAIGRTFLVTKNILDQEPQKSRQRPVPKPQAHEPVRIPARKAGQTSTEYALSLMALVKQGASVNHVLTALVKDLQQQIAAQSAALAELEERRRQAAEERKKARLADPNRLLTGSEFLQLWEEMKAAARPAFLVHRNGHASPGAVHL